MGYRTRCAVAFWRLLFQFIADLAAEIRIFCRWIHRAFMAYKARR